ncbi:GxxExxY protein [Candidatus Magnetomonas plexicatena]|uniref:GxxExxY protein n=1 Tax=Candidatus Magnetomonas plexicatena TaxID=2552947 RepID=UPI001C781317|nr:GxxExxY protein [Nitrospirales bacterium LBB_01]
MRDTDERDEDTYNIIGAAMRVHSELGGGFLEALEIEFKNSNIIFSREKEIPVYYKNKQLNVLYKADFICFEHIVVELKALNKLSSVEESQVINYLKATGLNKALLLNFGTDKLQFKRLVLHLRTSAQSADKIF